MQQARKEIVGLQVSLKGVRCDLVEWQSHANRRRGGPADRIRMKYAKVPGGALTSPPQVVNLRTTLPIPKNKGSSGNRVGDFGGS